MESHEYQCLACGSVFCWSDFKTGIGKSQAQLDAWTKRRTVCHSEKCDGPMVSLYRRAILSAEERAQRLASMQTTEWDVM